MNKMDAYQELIGNIRESRMRMSEESNHDPKTYIAHLKTLETKYAKQIESFQQRRKSPSTEDEAQPLAE